MQTAKIVAIVAGVIGAGVGIYFLFRNRLSNVEEQPLLQEPEKQRTVFQPRIEKLVPKPRPLKLAYQNTEEWELIRDQDGRINKVVIHRKVMEGG